MASDVGSPKRESTPSASLSSIPQKRALDDGQAQGQGQGQAQGQAQGRSHSPAIPSPLNPDIAAAAVEDAGQVGRYKSSRTKKESLKKREAKASESNPATPDPRITATTSPAAAGPGAVASATATAMTTTAAAAAAALAGTGTGTGPGQGTGTGSMKETVALETGPLRYKLAPPKPSDFDAPRGPVMTLHHQVTGPDGETIDFMETSDHVSNKKNFRYTHCIADPLFPSIIYYRQTEPEPFGPRMSFEDAATHVFFDRSGRQVTTDKGFRMARANVAVREGRWYWECKITQGIRRASSSNSSSSNNNNNNKMGDSATVADAGGRHVRVGWARREASLDAPVGFDAYSYGIRDVLGEKVFMSRPKEFFPAVEGGIREGDVIGLEIQLPSEQLHREIMAGHYNPAVDAPLNDGEHEQSHMPATAEGANIVRDRVPIRFKAHTYFEKIEYHSCKELEDLMNPSPAAAAAAAASASAGRHHSSNGAAEPPSPTHPIAALRTLPNSHIRIYKNGVLMGTAFEDLLGFLPPASKPMPQVGAREGQDDGMLGYYPAVSVFRGGAAEVNFGPDFWYPPPDYDSTNGEVDMIRTDTDDTGRTDALRAVSERYRDQIAEDIVYDIIDEVDFWMQDSGGGAASGRAAGEEDKGQKTGLAPEVEEEIKELVDDDWGEE